MKKGRREGQRFGSPERIAKALEFVRSLPARPVTKVYVVECRWNEDPSVFSHILIHADSPEAAVRKANAQSPEHTHRVVEERRFGETK
jgi:hypothetical protein